MFLSESTAARSRPRRAECCGLKLQKARELPAKLRELKYVVVERGSTTRIVGAAPSLGRAAERTYGAPSPFVECDVVEITLSGK